MKGAVRTLVTTLALATLASTSFASLFSDDFDADHTSNWTVNNGPTDSVADFFFDYSKLGIPSANGAGGSTRGLMMLANQSSGIFGGLSVSPTGQSFTGNYRVSADIWLNFVGPAPGGGSGSTQLGGMGIGTDGATAQWPGNANSVYFMTTTDGNSSADWRAYSSAATSGYGNGDPVYYAPSRNASDPYYAVFGGVTPPAAQTALFPSQTGATQAGNIAFGWHKSVIEVVNGLATWSVDGLKIATVDLGTVNLAGSNILFNYSDTNSSSSTDANDFLNTVVYDNVSVESVPEPGTMALLGLGVAAVVRKRSKK
ncbi:MAG: PEP-CTERM sorting domain-containing protein [Fimbriimonadaceae bacterium]|nr:PEP-CTERM sorting domain-containing protein [Fimbriimonadaceae bacterium]